MIEDKPIDYKTEYNKTINKLVSLRQKHDGLKEDHDYIKSLADRYFDERIKLKKENEQLKEIPIKLDNRIEKLQEDLQKLSEIDTTDLNQQAVEDVATVIVISLNALMEFRKELKGV